MSELPTSDALGIPRTCVNCGYRRGSIKYGTCLLSGIYPDLTRNYRQTVCNKQFSGWIARPGLIRRIINLVMSAI